MCITMLNKLEDPSSDQWINGLRFLHRIGEVLCSLKAYGMSHSKIGIISPLYNKFSTDHYCGQRLEVFLKHLQGYLKDLFL